jgi:Protein of unknown function (DUF998)
MWHITATAAGQGDVVGWLMRLAAMIAAIAAAVDLLVLGLLHVVSPKVDPVSRPVSEYALGEFVWLATIMTVAEGVGAIALAVALRRERAAALLLLVFGLMKLAMPLFPVDALGMLPTSAGRVHNVLGNLTFVLLPVAALLLFRALRRMGSRLASSMPWCWRLRRSECRRGVGLGSTCLPHSVRALAALRRWSDTSQPSRGASVRLLQDEPVTQWPRGIAGVLPDGIWL